MNVEVIVRSPSPYMKEQVLNAPLNGDEGHGENGQRVEQNKWWGENGGGAKKKTPIRRRKRDLKKSE